MRQIAWKSILLGGASAALSAASAFAADFNIPAGDLKTALGLYMSQTGVQLIVSESSVKGVRTPGARGDIPADEALSRLLSGTGFGARHMSGAVAIVRDAQSLNAFEIPPIELAQAAAPRTAVETVTVTSSKLGGADVQSIPIAITALSQEQLTATQTAGGPDLVKQVPNLTFTKTNFTGYSIQIRGIGTQAISVTTDPAVAVAFNDIPFIRNHFFEQEFYDVSSVDILRGPQGTLYGRNATAGVVNLISAKPTDQLEGLVSADVGNYESRRLEGMLNLPLVDDRLDLRIAGELTKRNGYTFDETTGQDVDGRFLWSTRVSLGWKPTQNVQAYLIWEHFNENDDRERSSKQLCKRDNGPTFLHSTLPDGSVLNVDNITDNLARSGLSQGCLPVSLYSPESRETPNGQALPIVFTTEIGSGFGGLMPSGDPYLSVTQPYSLRVIQSELKPAYKAKNDTVEFNVDYKIAPELTFTSQTGYNNDFLASTEDFNRFNGRPGIFYTAETDPGPLFGNGAPFGSRYTPGGVLCDPQLGCSDKFVGEDLSQEHAWQLSQEVRLSSDFSGPFNFSIGGNYLHYETSEDYYVFLNLLTLESRFLDVNNVATIDAYCVNAPAKQIYGVINHSGIAFDCPYTDPTPLAPGFNGNGHNYFRSINPYLLQSYAGFGEVYYKITDELKLTGGLRWTDDQKHFVDIPSETLTTFWGYPSSGNVDQSWQEFTGRIVANWTPKLTFTDQTLMYASFSRGYKAGGANPPGPSITASSQATEATHPLTFKPEFVNAFELGSKNTLLDGALTLNGDVFYYDYKDYQISEIVDRTSINLNFSARVHGAELESTWEPVPGLRFNAGLGWEDSSLAKGSKAIDLMDRTAGTPGWMIARPNFVSTSNCIIPTFVMAELISDYRAAGRTDSGNSTDTTLAPPADFLLGVCNNEYPAGDAVAAQFFFSDAPYKTSGFDATTAPNGGAGFDKNLSGNQLPNAPPFTFSAGAQYSIPITSDWAGTLRGDFYWQSDSFTRVFNDRPLRPAEILFECQPHADLHQSGRLAGDGLYQERVRYDRDHRRISQQRRYRPDDQCVCHRPSPVRRAAHEELVGGTSMSEFTAIRRDHQFRWRLLTTVSAVALTASLCGQQPAAAADGLASDRPTVWIELGGQFDLLSAGFKGVPIFALPSALGGNPLPTTIGKAPIIGFEEYGSIAFAPENSNWIYAVSMRYGRAHRGPKITHNQNYEPGYKYNLHANNAFVNTTTRSSDTHAVLDFTVGRDFGLGMPGASSRVNFGIRFAQFESNTDTHLTYNLFTGVFFGGGTQYNIADKMDRSFAGIGPAVSWNSSLPISGSLSDGIALDIGANAAVLFGRQKATVGTSEDRFYNLYAGGEVRVGDTSITRRRQIAAPNLGGFADISFRTPSAKVSFGYRADVFFGVIDGGLATRSTFNRGFYGPFAQVSIGIGG